MPFNRLSVSLRSTPQPFRECPPPPFIFTVGALALAAGAFGVRRCCSLGAFDQRSLGCAADRLNRSFCASNVAADGALRARDSYRRLAHDPVRESNIEVVRNEARGWCAHIGFGQQGSIGMISSRPVASYTLGAYGALAWASVRE